jgi:hypothetical protein
MKAVIIIAKAIQICMASSVGIAVAFALYKVAIGQTSGMSIKPSRRYVDMKVKIKFLNRWCQVIYVDKTFVDKNHFNNYLNFMFVTYGYSMDEVWNNN